MLCAAAPSGVRSISRVCAKPFQDDNIFPMSNPFTRRKLCDSHQAAQSGNQIVTTSRAPLGRENGLQHLRARLDGSQKAHPTTQLFLQRRREHSAYLAHRALDCIQASRGFSASSPSGDYRGGEVRMNRETVATVTL